ncbi:protein kinase [Mariniblastus sp.]|nr:protein kinase [Mariniblastus sp.]
MTDPESIFEAALQLKGAEERQAFLTRACGNDTSLRDDIDELLKASDAAGSFLEEPLLKRSTVGAAASAARPNLSARDSDSDLHSPFPTIGNYEIQRRLGEGGMGTVYRARHLKLNKEVALKVLRVRANADQDLAAARFEQELQAIGSIDHPNIVRGLDAGELDGVVYLSMELLDGVDLHHATAVNKTLAIPDACEVGRQAARGLQFAHDHGLIHRDVKPSNLMLTADLTNQASVKVLDLGLALMQTHQTDERLTDEGVTMGTFLFMAPEQATDSKAVDHRADIFSLGATLFRLIAGKPPFSDADMESPAKILLALTTKPAPSLGSVAENVPAAIVDLVDRMLARKPEERPQDLHEVIRVLEPASQSHHLADVLSAELESSKSDQATNLNSLKAEVAGLLGYAEQSSTSHEDPDPDEAQILRQRVKKFWVDGVLARTVENETVLSLRREMRPDAVINPWERVTEIPLDSSNAQRPIQEIFEDSDRLLLILGQPGSGKSVTLLQLTRALLKQRGGSNNSIPVVLHLSTWTDRRQPLAAWIEQEISAKYQIPKKLGRGLVEDDRLLLLLDGLDEVRPNLQATCVEKINEFLETQPPPGMVVSCREADYDAIGQRLKLHGAVLLKPLSSEQIEKGLATGPSQSLSLLTSLQKHDSMMELAKSPLMLSVMKLSFSDPSEETATRFEALGRTPENLFQAFVDRMFRAKGKTEQSYTRDQTVGWLGWLARRMDERNQSVFSLEQLQPSWLATRGQQMLYALILSLGLGWACAGAIALFWLSVFRILDFGTVTSPLSLLWLFIQIPVWLMMIAAIDFRFFHRKQGEPSSSSASTPHLIGKIFLYGALWMLWPLIGWLTGVWSTGWTISVVLIGLMVVPMLGLQGRGKRVLADISTVEALGVSVRQSVRGGLWGLLVGYVVYLAYLWLWGVYLLDEPPDWFPWYWYNGIEIYNSTSWPVVGAACGMVMGGLVPKVLRQRTMPNQGLQMSLRNALIAGAFSCVVIGVTGFLAFHFWITYFENVSGMGLAGEVVSAASFTLSSAFFIALNFGGLDFIKHALTRRIMVAAGLIPKDLVDFLKHASRLSFLKRAGGAYIFNHQLLLKYFATVHGDAEEIRGDANGEHPITGQ